MKFLKCSKCKAEINTIKYFDNGNIKVNCKNCGTKSSDELIKEKITTEIIYK